MNRYDVGMVRKAVVSCASGAVDRARVLISCYDGCGDLVALLKGDRGEIVKARVAELLMIELGHATLTSAEDSNSEIRRAVKKAR